MRLLAWPFSFLGLHPYPALLHLGALVRLGPFHPGPLGDLRPCEWHRGPRQTKRKRTRDASNNNKNQRPQQRPRLRLASASALSLRLTPAPAPALP
jgi:hypothetical protein